MVKNADSVKSLSQTKVTRLIDSDTYYHGNKASRLAHHCTHKEEQTGMDKDSPSTNMELDEDEWEGADLVNANDEEIAEQEPGDPADVAETASVLSSPAISWSGYLSTDDDDEEPTLVPVNFGGCTHMEWSNLAPGGDGKSRW